MLSPEHAERLDSVRASAAVLERRVRELSTLPFERMLMVLGPDAGVSRLVERVATLCRSSVRVLHFMRDHGVSDEALGLAERLLAAADQDLATLEKMGVQGG